MPWGFYIMQCNVMYVVPPDCLQQKNFYHLVKTCHSPGPRKSPRQGPDLKTPPADRRADRRCHLWEVFQKKWSFFMTFAINHSWLLPLRGGGVSSAINVFFFNFFFLKTIENHSLNAKTRFAQSLSFILYMYRSWGDPEEGWIWQSAWECQFWTNYRRT